jgi:hypothetical protein
LGLNTQEAAIEYDYDSEKITDITGAASERINKITRFMSLDPWPLYTGTNSAKNILQSELASVFAGQTFNSLLNAVDVLILAEYAGAKNKSGVKEYPSLRFKGSSITFDDYASMAISIKFGDTMDSKMCTISADGTVTIQRYIILPIILLKTMYSMFIVEHTSFHYHGNLIRLI